MQTAKYVLFGALGVAAVLLLTSAKARQIREELEDKAKDNAEKWKGRLWTMGSNAKNTLADLRDLLDSEIEGLSEDARAKIESVLNKADSSANGLKKNIANKLA